MIMRKLFSKKEDRYPTTAELLSVHMSKNDLNDLLSFCPDKRELFASAARALRQDVSEVVAASAEKFGFSYAERIYPMDLDLLPEDISLEHFKKIGAIGITKDHVLQGIVAVDPALVKKLFPNIGRADILLAPWSQIQEAITASEERYIESLAKKKEEEGLKSDLVTQIFDYIWSEALKHECHQIEFRFEKEQVTYVLQKEEGGEAKGTVHASFTKGMLHILKQDRERLPLGCVIEEVIEHSCYRMIRPVAEMKTEVEEAVESKLTNEKKSEEISQDIQKEMPDNVVHLPTRATSQENDTSEEAPTKPMLEGQVVIVDDNKVFRDVLTKFLERQGVTVLSFERAEQLLHDIKRSELSPDLIICDMHIPGMNGLAFVEQVRTLEDYFVLPIVMLSSDDTIETKLRCIGAGADLYLQKSEDPRLLCAHVERFLIKKQKSEAA